MTDADIYQQFPDPAIYPTDGTKVIIPSTCISRTLADDPTTGWTGGVSDLEFPCEDVNRFMMILGNMNAAGAITFGVSVSYDGTNYYNVVDPDGNLVPFYTGTPAAAVNGAFGVPVFYDGSNQGGQAPLEMRAKKMKIVRTAAATTLLLAILVGWWES